MKGELGHQNVMGRGGAKKITGEKSDSLADFKNAKTRIRETGKHMVTLKSVERKALKRKSNWGLKWR